MGKLSTLIAAVREVLDTRDLSTGLLRRQAFERRVEDWIGSGDARRPATSLLMVQIGEPGTPRAQRPDRAVLEEFARDLRQLLRATDIAGRVDDDTLGILLPSTPIDQGECAAQRILGAVRTHPRARQDGLAATIGISSADVREPWLAALEALRAARLAGGDQVVAAPPRAGAHV